jgi:hypothetical protein
LPLVDGAGAIVTAVEGLCLRVLAF